jgi:putative membrane protein
MMGGFGMGFGGIFWIAIVILIVVLVLRFLKQDKSSGRSESSPLDRLLGNSRNSSLDILKERYARGEIEKQEYEEKKKVLV